MKMNGALVTTLLLLTVTWTTGSSASSSNEDLPEPLPVPIALTQEENIPSSSFEENLVRRKRDLSSDLLEAASSLGIGGGYIKKFNTLINGVPPNVKHAFLEQDFSNVSESDIRNLNISVLEYIPPNVISKMNITYLNPVIERLLQANKPMALGRVMQAMGDKMDSNQLLDKIKNAGGMSDQNEESASVLLYTALNKVGDKGGINQAMIRRLSNEGLLSLVPEEQLMKVTDPNAAKHLLKRMYGNTGDATDLDDVDDRSLIYKLAETGYGEANKWSAETIRGVGSKILSSMPSDFLKNLSPDAVVNSISTLKDTKFETPLQAKSVADVYLQSNGVDNHASGEQPAPSGGLNLASLVSNLGPLAAFMNPDMSKDSSFLNSIVSACSKLNLPAPLKAISGLIKQKTSDRGKKIDDLGYDDLKEMGVSLLKSGPPQLVEQAMKTRALSENELNEISSGTGKGDASSGLGSGIFSTAIFQGIISQVSQYAIQYFTRGGKINFGALPGAFLGALGIKGMNDMSNRDLDDAVDKLKNNPDSLDDAQKALLLKKLRDAGMLDSIDLPPEIRNLQPRKKGGDADYDNILDGLPSDAELRLAHGQGKKITAFELEKDKNLVGTLTPSQVAKIDLEEIPAVLAVVRKSKDGPQAQTLEALSKRFAEYVRSKSEDYDSPDKKLLKYMTAAEVSKLPATVLAYFIDHRQTSKLPPDVRKEIMIAMGELSTKDHAAIPGKTRNEIILQGLDALDKLTGGTSKIDVPELAAIGQGVADLPPNEVEKLTPVALESAIQVIQGTSDDDDDGLKQRACLTPDQRKAWRKKIIENYGDPASWDPSTVSTLCCALGLLEEGDLRTIAPDALVTCQCVSDSKPPSHLAELKKALEANCKHELGDDVVEHPKKVVERVKSELTFDLDDLESQIITRRRRRSVDNLNCFKVRLTGSGSAFSKEQLETLDENELDNCLYELGVDPLTVDNARVIWKKLLASRNNQVKAEDVQNAGHILSGITINDVNELDLADPDIVLAFGKPLGLSKNVLEKLAMRLEQVKEKSVTQFDSEELVVTNNILCGFSSEQLTEIDADLLREALPVLKSIDPSCEQTRLAALAAVTVKADAFGDPKNWTSADVRGVGTILNGLPLSLVNTIPAESFLGVTPTVAAAMPETLLKELSAEQIANIPRFSAQAMSAEQVDAFGEEARDTLLSIIKGPTSSNGFSIQPQSQAFFLTATTLLIFRTAISYNVL